MENKVDVVFIAVVTFAFAFCLGMLIGDCYGYKKGYKDGFDRALPLTYATVYKK